MKPPPNPHVVLASAMVLPGSGQVWNGQPLRGLTFLFFIGLLGGFTLLTAPPEASFVGRHAGEEVVTGVERAHVIEAEPTVIAGAIETRRTHTGRTEFSRLVATGNIAKAPGIVDAAMELVLPHWASTWCLTR